MDGDKAKNSHRAVLLAVAAMIIVLLVGVSLAVSGAFTDKSTAKATEPDHPFLLTATAGSSLVHLTWAEPSSDGGSPITAYTVHYGPTQVMASERIFSNTTLAADIDGVIPGTAYYFTVSANNSIGAGILSNRLSACPFTLPGAPTQALAASGNGLVNLTWSAPTSDGSSPISGYRVYWGTDLESMTSSRDIVPALCTAQIGSLTPGSRYYFALAAVNSAGVGPRSVIVNATPFTIPGAPLQATVEASDGMITLTWAAPGSDGASAMTGYRIFWGIDEAMLSTPLDVGPNALSLQIGSLTPGQHYFFTVAAMNDAGLGPASTRVDATPYSIPGAPTLVATPGYALVSLSWAAPAYTGGLPIICYRLYWGTVEGQMTMFGDLDPFMLDTQISVEPGQRCFFAMAAVNDFVMGPMSEVRNATAYFAPDAPTDGWAEPGNEMVTLTWTAPVNAGSIPLTGYRIYWGPAEYWMVEIIDVDASQFSCQIAGLLPGNTYYFAVSAMSGAGTGPSTSVFSAIPYAMPDPPYLQWAEIGVEEVTIYWSQPYSDGGRPLLGYKVFYGGSMEALTQFGEIVDPSSTSVTVTGLTPYVAYYFTLTSVTMAGEGTYSEPMVRTPVALPQPPSITGAVIGPNGITITWAPPLEVAQYPTLEYTLYCGTTSPPAYIYGIYDSGTTSAEVTGLTPGTTYYFGVAVKTIGIDYQYQYSVMSIVEAIVMEAVPTPPTLVSAIPGDGMVTLTWTAPIYEGSPVLGYTVVYGTAAPGQFGRSVQTTGTSIDVTGLTAGLGYHFYVKALNRIGEGLMSNCLIASPLGAAMLSEIALAQADLPLGWEVYSQFCYGYQGAFAGNVTDSGGASYVHNGSVQESAVINFLRYSNQADADYVYTLILNSLATQGIPITELALGDKAIIVDRDTGMGIAKQIFMLDGNDIIFIIYSVSSGTAEAAPAIALAELQVAKIAALA